MSKLKAEIIAEDPRYPKLILQGEGWTHGYWVDPGTGELNRFCICAAHDSSECLCGVWDD